MIFNLLCPECKTENSIEADVMIVEWICDNCSSQPITSLGVDENGDLING